MQNKWVSLFSVLALSVFSAACTPPNKDVGSTASEPVSGGPASDWKEGYGGDSIAIEVVRHIETICFRTRAMRKNILNSALETDKDVSAEICGLLEPNALTVEPIEQPSVKGIAKDAANYPNARPRRLEIKRGYWSATATESEKREALLLHEILPLIGLEDADYVRSTRMIVALEAKINRITILSCDEKRIEALFAAGDAEFLKHYTKDFGYKRCWQMIDVLKKHIESGSFEDQLNFDIQHYFIWGLFTELARAQGTQELDKLTSHLRTALVSFPDAFRPWSPETCSAIAQHRDERPKSCGGFLNVVAGASSALKYMTGNLEFVNYNESFERASVLVLGMVRNEKTWELSNNPLLKNDQISSSIVQSAIQGQNWMTLYYLGRLQRHLNPEFRPSDILLREINFRIVKDNAHTGDLGGGEYDHRATDMKHCMPGEIRAHAAMIVDGLDVQNMRCGSRGEI